MDIAATSRWVRLPFRAALFTGIAILAGAAAHSAEIVYDVDPASGRVTKATYPDGSYISYQYDANGNRTHAIVTDLGAPTAPGVPSFSAIGSSSATASWTPATDNVAVTGYQYRVNGGSWIAISGSPVSLTGLTSAANYTFEVRAQDNASNFGPASTNSFTTLDDGAPTAPGTPSFSSITATSATASWTAATDNVGVTGYEYSLNGGSWVSNGLSLSVNLSGLTTATSYTLQVRARDAATNFGPASSNSFSTLDNVAPSAPGTPSFSTVAQNSATASWTAATDNVAVTEYQYSLNGGAWTSNGTTLSKSLTGLSAATSYTLQVRAKDGANNMGGASSNSFTTTDMTPPSAPGTPSFSSVTATSATASWTAATDNVGVTSYEYSLNGGAWTSNGAALSKSFSGLTSGASYTLQVRAKDAAGNPGSASSNSLSTLDNLAPSAPGTPSFSAITGTTATASWAAATDNVGVTGYEYSLNGGSWTSNGATLSKNFTGLTPATSYTLQVRALDGAGNPGSASSNSFSTPDTVAPSAPGAPSFSSVTGSSASASWGAASDNVGVTGYQWRLNGGSWNSTGSSPASLTGLSPNTTYTFDVQARDAAGNWSASSSANFTTPVLIQLSSYVVWSTGANAPHTSTAYYKLTSSGDVMASGATWGQADRDVGDWIVPKSGMSNYQARQASGNCQGPAVGMWVSLASGVTWSKTIGGNSPVSGSCSMTVEISAIANPSVILGTAPITINTSF
jgi:YD repeat-containing protein